MRRKMMPCGFLFLLVLSVLATACVSDASMRDAEKKMIVEQVKTVVRNEFDLIYFKQTYNQYHEAIKELASEEYRAALSDEIVFGYNNETYTREDMANMPAEEYDRHKEHMLRLNRDTGLDNVRIIVKISDVYEGNQTGKVHIYVMENKELHDDPMTTTTKKYSLEKRGGKWLVTHVEQDKVTHGSDDTAEEIEDGIKGLKFQLHDGEAVRYTTISELQVAEK